MAAKSFFEEVRARDDFDCETELSTMSRTGFRRVTLNPTNYKP